LRCTPLSTNNYCTSMDEWRTPSIFAKWEKAI
jgi:hypothetical protein